MIKFLCFPYYPKLHLNDFKESMTVLYTEITELIKCLPLVLYSYIKALTTVTKKVSRGIGILRYAKQYLPPATIETMYRSLVEPYFRYCCLVWGNAGLSIIGKLQKLQNPAAKLITNSPFDASPLLVIHAPG